MEPFTGVVLPHKRTLMLRCFYSLLFLVYATIPLAALHNPVPRHLPFMHGRGGAHASPRCGHSGDDNESERNEPDEVDERTLSRILDSSDHLRYSSLDMIESGGLALFFRMLNWMEIEGTIVKSIQKLKNARRPKDEEERQRMEAVFVDLDGIVHHQMKRFFNEISFTRGVVNLLTVAYVFGACPQHVWLLYLIEGAYLLPRNWWERVKAKPLNRGLTYLDCCWVCNIFALLSLILLVLQSAKFFIFPDAARKHLYVWAFGTSCGQLMGAAISLPFVAMLFHDLNTMAGLFIHMFPPMVAYTLRWHPNAIHSAYPRIFNLNYLDELHFFPGPGQPLLGTIAGNAIAGYSVWFVAYVTWMLTKGLDLPRKDRTNPDGSLAIPKYDTCFHIAMRGGACIAMGKKFWKRSVAESVQQMKTNHFEAKDFMVYMATHACGAILAILGLGYFCYSSRVFHLSSLAFMAVLSAFRGAKRYTYYTTDMYSQMLRKHFRVLNQVRSSKQDLT